MGGLVMTSCSHEGELRGYLTVEKLDGGWVISARAIGQPHPEVIVEGEDLHEACDFALPYLTVTLEDHDAIEMLK
jgi:hypothetical protein